MDLESTSDRGYFAPVSSRSLGGKSLFCLLKSYNQNRPLVLVMLVPICVLVFFIMVMSGSGGEVGRKTSGGGGVVGSAGSGSGSGSERENVETEKLDATVEQVMRQKKDMERLLKEFNVATKADIQGLEARIAELEERLKNSETVGSNE